MWSWRVSGHERSGITMVTGVGPGVKRTGAISRIEEAGAGFAWSTFGKSGRARDWPTAVTDLKNAMREVSHDARDY